MNILTISCWSHAVRYHLFCWSKRAVLASGTVERVDFGNACLRQFVPGREPYRLETGDTDLQSAVPLIIDALTDPQHGAITKAEEISAVGHRVAHGGKEFRDSVRIDAHVLEAIRELQTLAPLHAAPNIAGIEAAMARLPAIPHVAIFDTAFHHSLPKPAYIYPLPYEWYERYGVRRYGFHGPSHLYLSRRAAVLLGKPAVACNLITIHLDKGVSLCAIRRGESIDTSMGLTPLEGAVMETRCGDIDPGIPVFMMQELALSRQELEQILNHKSGTLGITGEHLDRQHFLQAVLQGDPRAGLALEIETYRMRKYIGSYLAALGSLDGIVFTAGTGETDWLVRERVLEGLEFFGIRIDRDRNRAASGVQEADISADGSPVKTLVIPTNEELVFVEDVLAILAAGRSDHLRNNYSFALDDFDSEHFLHN